jgi:four helix bundle protein
LLIVSRLTNLIDRKQLLLIRGMSKTSFEKLEVYQLAEKLADEIWRLVAGWENFPKHTVGKQIVEASDSVCANIAEGCGRFSYKDNSRFIRIARGSLYETKNWLRRAYIRRLLADEQVEKLKPLLEELLPKLNAYLRSIKKKAEEEG